ncbi:polysaccharide pyruvyl transferase WcaK-like protein [Microbacterium sp. SORGH_AS428]|uniref:polysaccharide pyruvyl transferase family protein n=1 Tax=Microbacterium sp. SORGH_AS_0428 TaxID=3041788 RepID=UPI0028604EC5|nr:polysaccharide pyruvyl transferase family protein [Microbacterium sp. SORGH_AS_0428]MDR6199341.1 polysaccharide pyruvyl transferase WcaK-like protein [Microbacterium sp. SORGH_AS_0428]
MSVLAIGDVGVVDDLFHVGDEAMFDAAVVELRRRGIDTIGISSSPGETSERYGIDAVDRLGFAGLDRDAAARRAEQLVAAATGGTELTADDAAQGVLDALGTVTGVLHTGGGNLASRWPVHIYERTTLTQIAAARGLPVAFSGQTFGPDLIADDEIRLRAALAASALIGVREGATDTLVRSWELEPRRQVDDASFLDAPAVVPASGPLLVSLSGWYAHRPSDAVDAALARMIDTAAEATGAPVVFHAHFGPLADGDVRGDVVVHERVRARLHSPSRLETTADTAHAVALARSARLLISSRYHPVVFAAPSGVPVLALAADEYTRIKLTGALEPWAQDGVIDIDDAAAASALLPSLISRAASLRGAAAERFDAHRSRASQWWDDVAAALG